MFTVLEGKAGVDFGDGPAGVFGDEVVIGLGGGLEGGEIVWGAGVAEGDADVAEKARAFEAFDRGLLEEIAEAVVGEGEEIAEREAGGAFAEGKGGFA